MTGHRIVRLSARTLTTRAGEPRTRPWCSSRPTRERSARPSSARSPRAARTGCGWRSTASEESLAFDQEEPESLWCGRRESVTILKRDPAFLSEPAARLAWLPAGHAQGYGDCFAAFVADAYAAIRDDAPVDGLPVFADGLRPR